MSRRKQPRQRVLSDDELRCLWKATGQLGYPWRQLFRLLLVTGTRKTEAAGARWREFLDLDDPGKARGKFRPSASRAMPRTWCRCRRRACRHRDRAALNTATTFLVLVRRAAGAGVASGQGAARRVMLRYLRALARLRGDDPARETGPLGLHDLRRVVRTKLAALEVNDTVAECLPRSRPQGSATRLRPARLLAADASRVGSCGRANCAASCRRRLRPRQGRAAASGRRRCGARTFSDIEQDDTRPRWSGVLSLVGATIGDFVRPV